MLTVTRAPEVRSPVDTPWLRTKLNAIIRELRIESLNLNVVVVNDPRMSDLHERFAGVRGTTDVLTFDLKSEISDSQSVDGEIYICIDEARRRAKQLGHDIRLELLLYAMHGLLHLLGYDDHTARGFRAMHQKEDELLSAIGIGAVFTRKRVRH